MFLAQELKMDPAELRLKNFIPPDKFPYQCPLGWNYDSGNYKGAMDLALDKIGYQRTAQRAGGKTAPG